MRSRRITMLTALVASSMALAVSAQAASQVGQTNQFLTSDRNFSFSLSLAPISGGTQAISLPQYDARVSTSRPANGAHSPTSRSYSLSDGTKVWDYLDGESATNLAGVFVGDSALTQAPVSAPGTGYAGAYLATVGTNSRYASHLWFTGGTNSTTVIKSMNILWGSVEASNLFAIDSAASAGFSSISGAEILAAASALGIGGGIGGSQSYYVTINAQPGKGFYSTFGYTGAGTAFEYATLSVSKAEANYAARDSYSLAGPSGIGFSPASSDAGAGTAPQGAPAPVVGATSLGGLLSLGMLGGVGLRSRRRNAAAA